MTPSLPLKCVALQSPVKQMSNSNCKHCIITHATSLLKARDGTGTDSCDVAMPFDNKYRSLKYWNILSLWSLWSDWSRVWSKPKRRPDPPTLFLPSRLQQFQHHEEFGGQICVDCRRTGRMNLVFDSIRSHKMLVWVERRLDKNLLHLFTVYSSDTAEGRKSWSSSQKLRSITLIRIPLLTISHKRSPQV